MTGIDEHIRNINRAISYVPTHTEGGQDARAAARTALHHIAAREQEQRERIAELEAELRWQDEARRGKTAEVAELQARVQELEAELRIDLGTRENVRLRIQRDAALARVQELDELVALEQARYKELQRVTRQHYDRVKELEAEVKEGVREVRRLVQAKVDLQAENERLRATIQTDREAYTKALADYRAR